MSSIFCCCMWMEKITFLFNKGQTVEYIYTINNNKISCLRVCVCKSCRNPGMLDPPIPDRGHICRQCQNCIQNWENFLQIWLLSVIVVSQYFGVSAGLACGCMFALFLRVPSVPSPIHQRKGNQDRTGERKFEDHTLAQKPYLLS